MRDCFKCGKEFIPSNSVPSRPSKASWDSNTYCSKECYDADEEYFEQSQLLFDERYALSSDEKPASSLKEDFKDTIFNIYTGK